MSGSSSSQHHGRRAVRCSHARRTSPAAPARRPCVERRLHSASLSSPLIITTRQQTTHVSPMRDNTAILKRSWSRTINRERHGADACSKHCTADKVAQGFRSWRLASGECVPQRLPKPKEQHAAWSIPQQDRRDPAKVLTKAKLLEMPHRGVRTVELAVELGCLQQCLRSLSSFESSRAETVSDAWSVERRRDWRQPAYSTSNGARIDSAAPDIPAASRCIQVESPNRFVSVSSHQSYNPNMIALEIVACMSGGAKPLYSISIPSCWTFTSASRVVKP